MLTVLTPPVFSYYSDLVLRQQPGQGLVGSDAVIEVTVLTVFRFLCDCRDGTVGFTCHDEHMVLTGGVFWGLMPPRLANASMKSGYLGSWRGHHPILLLRLSPSRDPLRRIGRASFRWILGFHMVGKLMRYSTWLKVKRRYHVKVPFTEMSPLRVELCTLALFVSRCRAAAFDR